MGRRRRWIGRVALAAAVAVTAGAAAVVGFGGRLRGSDDQADAGGALPPQTARVTRQTLVDTQTRSSELGYGDTTTFASRLTGTVTSLPDIGSTRKRGQAIYRIDNTPVVLLYGSLPAYRALSVGTEGDDVKQFEQNLQELGFSGFTVDSEYTASTAKAVQRWQKDLNLLQTGTVELGRVSYAAGPVRVDTLKAAVGEMTQPGTALLACTGTSRVITVELDVDDQRLASNGAAVTVTMPDGKTAPAKITKAVTVVKPAEGSNPAATKIEVTITVDDEKALDSLAQEALDVTFTATERKDVLTVPVAALLALAEGGYGVQVVEGAATRIVAVQTGLFAGGRVEVSGDALTEGMTVGMPA
ncbi:peptidoglycan-binding protein [Micromonospora deserti]|uniref:Peptidoglycan-binding protein n=1 Tax=Micromonospora deserti TaxID=2070366 RepID=A0A2W2D9G1_9ACTN|nr:peptidoglycan-binding protein [Micromonospora deserti]